MAARRCVVFDTETTGRSPAEGDRIVEIGAVEMIGFEVGRTFHRYLNPEWLGDLAEEVIRVHGLRMSFLADKPKFAEIVADLLAFFGADPIVAHNAEFDRGFLNAELARLSMPEVPAERFVDTYRLAKQKLPPGKRLSLDALALHYELGRKGFDLAARKGPGGHGALLDAQMLAEIYVELQGGREQTLAFMQVESAKAIDAPLVRGERRRPRPSPLPPLSTAKEREAHAAFVATLGENAMWTKLG